MQVLAEFAQHACNAVQLAAITLRTPLLRPIGKELRIVHIGSNDGVVQVLDVVETDQCRYVLLLRRLLGASP